jgi:hypothetical protein
VERPHDVLGGGLHVAVHEAEQARADGEDQQALRRLDRRHHTQAGIVHRPHVQARARGVKNNPALGAAGLGVPWALPSFVAATMTSSALSPAATSVHELASRIYVELVGRAFLRTDNTAVIKPDAAELAKLSIQLADIFGKVEKAANAAAAPQNVGYKVDLTDMAKWDSK